MEVGGLGPCAMCLPSSPARLALGVRERCGGWLATQWHTIPSIRQKPHQQLSLSSSALPREPIDQVLSREAPERSQPAFAFGDVVPVGNATDIRSVTEWPSLPLPSHTRITYLPQVAFAEENSEYWIWHLTHELTPEVICSLMPDSLG